MKGAFIDLGWMKAPFIHLADSDGQADRPMSGRVSRLSEDG
jgi:hypothetical protein